MLLQSFSYSYRYGSDNPLLLVFFGFFCLVFLVIGILFLVNMQRLLEAVAPQNRRMPPGQVWLMLIPFFNIVWQFIMVDRVTASIEAEYRMRNLPMEPRPTYNLGLIYCILTLTSWIPIISVLTSIGLLVVGIMYWIKTAEYRKAIRGLPAQYDRESDIFGEQ